MPKNIIGMSRAKNTCHFHFAIKNKSKNITIPNPIRDIAAVAPKMEMGIVSSGTKALRAEPINARTTKPTSNIVSPSVLKISATASRM